MLTVLGFIADISFLRQQLDFARKQKLKTSNILKYKNREASLFLLEQQKIKILQSQYDEKLKHFNGAYSVADILNFLEKSSVDSQIELQLLEPQTTKEDAIFVIYSIKLETNGSYKNLIKFINNVFKQEYFIVFEEVYIQKKIVSSLSDELNMQVLLTVYKNKSSNGKKPLGSIMAKKNIVIASPKHDIFVKTVSGSRTNLFLWAVMELHFLGLIKQGQMIYGVICDPMGTVHRIAVGDKIGLEQNKVDAIDVDGISVINKNGNTYRIGMTR